MRPNTSASTGASWARRLWGRLVGGRPRTAPPARARGRGLRLEVLEDRLTPALLVVDTTADVVDPQDSQTSLREAILAANSAGGGTITFQVDGTIALAAALPGLSGTTEVRGNGADRLVITRGSPFQFRLFTVTPGSAVTISGVTVANGSNGVFSTDAALTVEDCVFAGNSAPNPNAGAAIYFVGRDDNTLTVRGCTFRDNTTGGGGAIWFQTMPSSQGGAGTATISGSTFLRNTAFAGGAVVFGGGAGSALTVADCAFLDNAASANFGALRFFSTGAARLTVTGSTFERNTAGGSSGALSFQTTGGACEVTVADCSFLENSATAGSGALDFSGGPDSTLVVTRSAFIGNSVGNASGGGAVTVGAGTATVTDSTFADNRSGFSGGGLHAFAGNHTLIVSGCTFSGNQARLAGGGLYFVPSSTLPRSLTLTSSTFSGNAAGGDGGGLRLGGPAEVSHCTFTANRADADGDLSGAGGGVSFGSPTTFRNTLVAGNFRGPGTTRDDVRGTVSAAGSYNLVGDGTGMTGLADGVDGNRVGTAAAPIDPLLGPLADNGGPTRTHALLPGSPALDAGGGAGAPPFDQRGLPRVAGGGIDIGAFELQAAAPPATVVGVLVNDGSAQRSRVTSLTVTFGAVVNLEPGAFEVLRQGCGTVGLDVAVSVVAGRTVAVLTFTGPGVVGGSLADGNYTLVVRGDRVRDGAGRPLDGDGDGAAGGDRAAAFFRLYGDGDGDRDVDVADLLRFACAVGGRAGQPGYLGYFDYDGDGDVGLAGDLPAFLWRLGRRLPG